MLDEHRFTTTDPGRLSSELDRFVLAVRRELASGQALAQQRYRVRQVVHGMPGSAASIIGARFGDWIQTSPALGKVDVVLPTGVPEDAGKSVLVSIRSAANPVSLRVRGSNINMTAAGIALPSVVAAYLVFFDGSDWWTVNDAT